MRTAAPGGHSGPQTRSRDDRAARVLGAASHDTRALSLWLRLMKAHSLVLRRVRQRMAPDLTLPQFDVLAQIARSPEGPTPADLSRRLLVTAGNLTGIVDRLVSRGLVRRERDPSDGRKVRLNLTEIGKHRVATLHARHAADLEEILSAVSREERDALRELLSRFNRALERHEEKK